MIFQILVWWTLGLTAAIVLALAVYLIPVAWFLYRTSVHLTKLVGGLKAVRENATPLTGYLTNLGGGLTLLRDELMGVDGSLADASEILSK
ncbi:MAG: hypothetical protein M3Y86_12180 [Verrucomicrobiota bacterium]|nr:hypothetical protein [Verrucomicrobiota bacterium]